jgi:nicotinate-nucleotide adenylyltransferase
MTTHDKDLVNHDARTLPIGARVGILGGTFDPIHLGHLILAEEARVQLALDRVYLVPAGAPPHKQDRQIAAAEHRICMAELATAAAPQLWVSRVDVDRPGPHYSLAMVRLLREAIGTPVELFFLMGLDSLRDLPTWQAPQELLDEVTIVAVTRPDIEIAWERLESTLPGLQNRVILLQMPALGIASSTLRQQIQRGRSIRFQVVPAVEAYIAKHGLYR